MDLVVSVISIATVRTERLGASGLRDSHDYRSKMTATFNIAAIEPPMVEKVERRKLA